MNTLQIASFRDLMNGQPSAKIINVMGGDVVRTLTVVGDNVNIVAGNGEMLEVPIDEKIYYEPWVYDRGSLLFGQEESLKICTELDHIEFPNGETMEIHPKNR